ncbi:MAG: hypothetical protein OXB88_08880 [Bacteriovoracales bacterium]|nr:hypothetical protein [Bacteriovoracales bacterium]
MNQTIIFAPITQREVNFYPLLAQRMAALNSELNIYFLPFYEPGIKTIEKKGFKAFNIYKIINNLAPKDFNVRTSDIEEKYGIENLRLLCLHEYATYNIRDIQTLLEKFKKYIMATEIIFDKIDKKNTFVFQELGGFVAPLSLFLVSKRHHIPHFFFEPSYFRGRLHFNMDTLQAIFKQNDTPHTIHNEVKEYIEGSNEEKKFIVPFKDRHHYRKSILLKIFRLENIKKIACKIHIKYIRRQKQEYEHIWNHCRSYLQMLVNNFLGKRFLSKDLGHISKKFVFFPLHFKFDYAMTVRAPFYLDQLSLVDFICKILPDGYDLVVKEHPAGAGGFSASKIKELKRANSNFNILSASFNTYDLIEKSSFIITVNSKVGYEALALGKEVIVLGDSFYRHWDIVWKVESLFNLVSIIKKVTLEEKKNDRKEQRLHFFSKLWDSTFKGELYENTEENVKALSESLLDAISNVSEKIDEKGNYSHL